MTNNDLLRLITVSFSLDDKDIKDIFTLGDIELDNEKLANFCSKDKPSDISDLEISSFLNGLIEYKRGPSPDGKKREAKKKISYNTVLKKIKIAMNLHNEDIIAILASVGIEVADFELSAYLRREDHKNYRPIRAQLLRNFIFAIGEVYGL